MAEKLIAHCIHHTHWDPYWWFTSQESMVVFAYNMREMLRAFESGELEDFFLDGQTTATYEYLQLHPQETETVSKWVKNGKLSIGPFVSQLDAYISSAESVVNNLRLGIKYAKSLGKANRVAYLADPFGYPADFPKILNQCGIHDFVFTRGMGDLYGVGTEFFFRSNDGSEVLCNVLLSGYGYGANAFRNKTLFTNQAEDYNKIDVARLINRLVERSTLENEFVFPLGFDNHPIMRDIPEKISFYNESQKQIEFKYTNWPDFFARVRKYGKNIKTFEGEIFSPQYHRIHVNGMNSARSDIKTLIDKVDRRLTYELQPMMALLDAAGIPYDQGIIDQAWYLLVNCQTHGSATHGDITNEWIKDNASYAYYIARGTVDYLSRLIAVSVDQSQERGMAMVVFNTLPWKRRLIQKMSIITNTPSFTLELEGKELPYQVLQQIKHYFGVARKDPSLMTEDKWYYRTEILCDLGEFDGICYKTLSVVENDQHQPEVLKTAHNSSIENDYLLVSCTADGISITDKLTGQTIDRAFFFEDGGDEGDSYDYDYPAPEDEWLVTREITQKDLVTSLVTGQYSELKLEGEVKVPSSLSNRKQKIKDASLPFSVTLSLTKNSKVLRIAGEVTNKAENHRLRLGLRTSKKNENSFAGGQYSVVKRPCLPEEMAYWKERNYFEEPSATRPLLNHVSAVDEQGVLTVHTRSLKEYEFVGENFSDLMLTVLRAVGYVGLPDLHRRPGRPSGMPERLMPAPTHQLMGTDIEFDLGVSFSAALDANALFREYAEFAVNPLYGQNQTIDPTFYPISYFPINRWPKPLPRQFQLASLKDPGISFGTLIKSDTSADYILRLFNADSLPQKTGELMLGQQMAVTAITDLVEESKREIEKLADEFKSGELINLVIQQNGKDA